MGLPETTTGAPYWSSSLVPRDASSFFPTTTVTLYPKSTLPACPSATSLMELEKRLPYPNHHKKREPAGTFNLALVASKSESLRGKDVQRLREMSMHIYAKDFVRLKGSDFEVKGDVTWTRVSFDCEKGTYIS